MNDTPTWMSGPELRADLAHAEIEILADLVRIHIAMLCLDGPKLLALPFLAAARARAGDLQRARMHYADQRRRLERLERDEPEPRGLIVPLFANDHGKVAQLRRVLEARAEGFAENITIH